MYLSFASLILIIVALLIAYFCFRDTVKRVGHTASIIVEESGNLAEIGIKSMVQLASHNSNKMQLQLQQEQEDEIAPAYARLKLNITPEQFHRAITQHQAELISDSKGHLLPQNQRDAIIKSEVLNYINNLRNETQAQPQAKSKTTVKPSAKQKVIILGGK